MASSFVRSKSRIFFQPKVDSLGHFHVLKVHTFCIHLPVLTATTTHGRFSEIIFYRYFTSKVDIINAIPQQITIKEIQTLCACGHKIENPCSLFTFRGLVSQHFINSREHGTVISYYVVAHNALRTRKKCFFLNNFIFGTDVDPHKCLKQIKFHSALAQIFIDYLLT